MIEYYGAVLKSKNHKDGGDFMFLGDRVFCSGESYGVSSQVMAVICDGGSHNPIVTKAITNSFTSNDIKYGGTTAIQMYLRKTNQDLHRDGKIDPHIATAIAIGGQIAREGKRLDFNVGNVRSYCHQGDKLKMVSNPKIYVQDENGAWSPSDQAALGAHADCLPHVDIRGDYDYSLICSDGVYRFVDGDDVEEIMAGDVSIQEKGRAILQLAMDGGSTDDASIIILRTYDPKT